MFCYNNNVFLYCLTFFVFYEFKKYEIFFIYWDLIKQYTLSLTQFSFIITETGYKKGALFKRIDNGKRGKIDTHR